MNAAKRKNSLTARLTALRCLLLLVVACCGLETRVWSFAAPPPTASGEIAFATPSFIGEIYDGVLYDASDSLVAAKSGAMRNVAQFQGMEVRAVRDLSHVEQGTLEAMQQHGFAATTRSGDSIVLHHLGQNPAGPLVEMPAANHSIWNSVQHPLGNTAGAGLSAAERATYNAWRTEYWQWRATQELNARRVLGQ